MTRTVLVLFCKEPRLGYGKQRLAASLGAEQAMHIAVALTDCALEDLAAWPGPSVIAPASVGEMEWARALRGRPSLHASEVEIAAQCDGNLGERLQEMDARLRADGADGVVFIGSDAPALTDTHYGKARQALVSSDIVLADGADGGVTLMASRGGWPPLEHLPWSTSRLGAALASACLDAGRSVLQFDGGHDLDEVGDIQHLLRAINDDPRPARRELAELLRRVARAR